MRRGASNIKPHFANFDAEMRDCPLIIPFPFAGVFLPLVVMSVNPVTFVAPNLAWGKARGASAQGTTSILRQWGCDRQATKPHAKFGATLRAAVLFDPGGVARSLQ